MDPLTHAVAGLALAALSGEPVSLTSPIYLGAMLGAMAPDLDIIYQLKGDMVYLKNHRGASHGLFGLAFFSAAISLMLYLFFPAAALSSLFIWSFIGGMSHTLLDILNSYGARCLAPFSQRNITVNLLTIFDPFLFIFFILIILGHVQLGWSGITVYLLFRWIMSLKVRSYLHREFPNYERIVIMPAFSKNFSWSFLVDAGDMMFTGEIPFFNCSYKVFKKMAKQNDALARLALQTPLGKLFTEFTPYFHIDLKKQKGRHVVRFFDLRYYTRKKFLHSATAIFDHNLVLQESVFQPYNEDRRININ